MKFRTLLVVGTCLIIGTHLRVAAEEAKETNRDLEGSAASYVGGYGGSAAKAQASASGQGGESSSSNVLSSVSALGGGYGFGADRGFVMGQDAMEGRDGTGQVYSLGGYGSDMDFPGANGISSANLLASGSSQTLEQRYSLGGAQDTASILGGGYGTGGDGVGTGQFGFGNEQGLDTGFMQNYPSPVNPGPENLGETYGPTQCQPQMCLPYPPNTIQPSQPSPQYALPQPSLNNKIYYASSGPDANILGYPSDQYGNDNVGDVPNTMVQAPGSIYYSGGRPKYTPGVGSSYIMPVAPQYRQSYEKIGRVSGAKTASFSSAFGSVGGDPQDNIFLSSPPEIRRRIGGFGGSANSQPSASAFGGKFISIGRSAPTITVLPSAPGIGGGMGRMVARIRGMEEKNWRMGGSIGGMGGAMDGMGGYMGDTGTEMGGIGGGTGGAMSSTDAALSFGGIGGDSQTINLQSSVPSYGSMLSGGELESDGITPSYGEQLGGQGYMYSTPYGGQGSSIEQEYQTNARQSSESKNYQRRFRRIRAPRGLFLGNV